MRTERRCTRINSGVERLGLYYILKFACLFIFLYTQANLSRKGCPPIYCGVNTCFDKALEINPGDVEAWIIKGQSLEEFGEFKGAINCYDKVLKINPEHKRAREYKEACLQKV